MSGKKYTFVGEVDEEVATTVELDDPAQVMRFIPGRKKKTRFGEITLYQIKRKDGTKGGWVESDLNLSQSGNCWIEEGAIVCGRASVIGDAVVKGGIVGDRALIGDEAVVEGNSVIEGGAVIFGHVDSSTVKDHGKVFGGAEVLNRSIVKDYAGVYGKADHATVGGTSSVYGTAEKGCTIIGKSTVMDGAVVSGPYVVSGCSVEKRFGDGGK